MQAFSQSFVERVVLAGAAFVGLLAASCASTGTAGDPPGLTLSLSTGTVVAAQDGTPAQAGASVSGNSGNVTLTVGGLPSGSAAQVIQPVSGAGSITFSSSSATPAGTYGLVVTATAGSASVSQNISLVVAVAAVIGNAMDANLGVNGRLQQFMATSFQPADFVYQFFQLHPDVTSLNRLHPQHIRIQAIDGALPMKADSQPQLASDWSFMELDAIVQPVLGVTDHSPEFQIALAPSFMNNAQGQLDLANHLNDFVQYCANLVRYYNKGGFDWGGQHFQSASAQTITWWGIFNEFNVNGLTASQYVQVYDSVVPAMLAVDPTIQFSAVEFADFSSQAQGDPRNYLPTLLASQLNGGVSAPVNVVSAHFYSSCNQQETDATLFNTVPNFGNDVRYFYQELKSRADLANVPVWTTENNVNSDFDKGGGISACDGTPFVLDKRGTSAFFAAWRPYVFSVLGKAGNQALYHWAYAADQQLGEVDAGTGKPYLSYWVDYTLGQMFPFTTASQGSAILTLQATEPPTSASTEILATKNNDGSVVVMVADRAVHAATDNNGAGDPRTVILDISALGAFTSATQMTIDASTNLSSGPVSSPISVAPKITVTLGGYGVTFLVFKP